MKKNKNHIMGFSFGERWLKSVEVPADQLQTKWHQVKQRVSRYPWPFKRLYPIAVWFLDWFGPLLLLFHFGPARWMQDDTFDSFCRKLKKSNILLLRTISIFVLLPLMEVSTQEQLPDWHYEHPLKKLDIKPHWEKEELYDVAIIGSGAGGAPLAWQLCRQGYRVLMVEKGKLIKPSTGPYALEHYYVGQGFTVSRNSSATLVMAGSALGGTTSINSGTCLRPLHECLVNWDDLTGMDFSSGLLDNFMEIAEKQMGVCVPTWEMQSKSAFIVKKGFEAIGREGVFLLPRNAASCKATGRCCFGCPTMAKKSTDLSFLPQAVESGLTLWIATEATNIQEEKDRVSIQLRWAGEKNIVKARVAVIAAGAMYSPLLIKKNRLGNRWKMAGRQLKIHPATKVFAWFPGLDHGEGGIPQGLGYKPHDLPRITMEGIHTPKSVTGPILSVGGDRYRWWLDRHNEMASFGLMVRDRGTGEVVSTPDFPGLKYKPHTEDAKDVVQGLKIIAEAFFAAGAKKVLLPIYGPYVNELNGTDDLDKILPGKIPPENIILSGFHPQGTAGISRLVDENLQLSGTDRIFVCDASVFPDSPGVNPQVTIMGFSLRLAAYIDGLMS